MWEKGYLHHTRDSRRQHSVHVMVGTYPETSGFGGEDGIHAVGVIDGPAHRAGDEVQLFALHSAYTKGEGEKRGERG